MTEPHIVKLYSWGGWMSGAHHDFLMSDGSIKAIEHYESLRMMEARRKADVAPIPVDMCHPCAVARES